MQPTVLSANRMLQEVTYLVKAMTNLVLISMSTATVTAAALRYIWADVLFLCNAMLHVCGLVSSPAP